MKLFIKFFFTLIMLFTIGLQAQTHVKTAVYSQIKTYYGTASYYADKFTGRKTANGDVYNPQGYTAACNVLPLNTWIRVTNLRNNKSVVVRTNDRLHAQMNRVVDLSKVAATELGYIKRGLTKVKVEVLGKKKPDEA